LGEFVDQIMEYQRDLMVVAAGSESASLQSVAPSNRPILSEQSQKWGLPTVILALQILAETKTRLQRSGMGRALAELALVRLCLLEEIHDLASLVADLCSSPGDAGAKGSAAPSASRAPSHARSLKTANSPVSAKILDQNPKVAQSETAGSTVSPSSPISNVPQVSAKEAVVFEPSHADAIWAQIAARIDVKDFLGRALTKVSRTAISGPNQLEVFFPSAYHGNKTHCEQPTALGRLEKVASEVVGKPVQVVCRLEAEPPQSPAAEGKPEIPAPRTIEGSPENRPQDPASVNDAYVERARTIFGATIDNVTVVNHRPVRGQTDEPESARES
jgi:DNA polymerase-3 subunit gamma/tau